MLWQDVIKSYPDKWVVVETKSCREQANVRIIDEVVMHHCCDCSIEAFQNYRKNVKACPDIDLLVASTTCSSLQIKRYCMG